MRPGYTASPGFREILKTEGLTLAVTTYQAGRLLLISPGTGDSISVTGYPLRRPMAMTAQSGLLSIAVRDALVSFEISREAARRTSGNSDALLLPRSEYRCGPLDIHALYWRRGLLFGLNTRFSCLVSFQHPFGFTPVWKPAFISGLYPEDRCHLNGVALEEGQPLYLTSLGTGDKRESWREGMPDGGAVISYKSGEPVIRNLPMPHSPRVADGALYLLFSATGEIVRAEPDRERWEVLQRTDGFLRGMAVSGDYLFIGMSRFRRRSRTFSDLDMARRSSRSGIMAFHRPSATWAGSLEFHSRVDEIFDVDLLPGILDPRVGHTAGPKRRWLVTSPGGLWAARPAGPDESGPDESGPDESGGGEPDSLK